MLSFLCGARLRSALTIGGVAVSLVLFGFVRAMEQGLAALSAQVERDNLILVFERNTF